MIYYLFTINIYNDITLQKSKEKKTKGVKMRMTQIQREIIRDYSKGSFGAEWEITDLQEHCLKEAFKVGMPKHFKAFYLQLFKVLNYKLKKFSK